MHVQTMLTDWLQSSQVEEHTNTVTAQYNQLLLLILGSFLDVNY